MELVGGPAKPDGWPQLNSDDDGFERLVDLHHCLRRSLFGGTGYRYLDYLAALIIALKWCLRYM